MQMGTQGIRHTHVAVEGCEGQIQKRVGSQQLWTLAGAPPPGMLMLDAPAGTRSTQVKHVHM